MKICQDKKTAMDQIGDEFSKGFDFLLELIIAGRGYQRRLKYKVLLGKIYRIFFTGLVPLLIPCPFFIKLGHNSKNIFLIYKDGMGITY